jgi:hypothetical protein
LAFSSGTAILLVQEIEWIADSLSDRSEPFKGLFDNQISQKRMAGSIKISKKRNKYVNGYEVKRCLLEEGIAKSTGDNWALM